MRKKTTSKTAKLRNAAETEQRKQEPIEERLRFEMLLAEISARFVNLPADQVDKEIEGAQRDICESLGLDLSALWQWSTETPHLFILTHLYRPLGGPPVPEPMDAQEYFPWSLQQLRAGKIIIVSSVDEAPAEAARDQETWRQFGVKTTLTFPLLAGGRPLIGALSFNDMREERKWSETLVKRLQLVAQIFTNALARKQADRELRESERRYHELLRIDRSSRLGELTASLAHELNQPLGAILSNAQAALRLLASGKNNPELSREILQNIVQDDKRAADIIRSLRSMVKKGETRKEPININEVLREIIDILRSELNANNITISLLLDETLPLVIADKTQIQQVALNLIMNAIDAMSQSAADKRTIILQTEKSNGFVRVSVHDSGPGIPSGNVDRVFDPFYTTKISGLGMGLTVCKHIITDHGGRILAGNNPEGGATFSFELKVQDHA